MILPTVRILEGDALSVLRTLPAATAHCCVTSPPFWGLRDYGTARWTGGEDTCSHVLVDGERTPWANDVPGPNGLSRNSEAGHWKPKYVGGHCANCGAVRVDQQIGLERTPDEYVTKLVDVFREVRRVLRDDGTLWLNLGDCYATGAGRVGEQGARWRGEGSKAVLVKHNGAPVGPTTQPNRMPIPGIKPKDLVGIPWRVAFALQADGWWLRSDIVWSKPTCMPESVRDRPTRAHEYVFLLSKNERYFYDADAIAEPVVRDDSSLFVDSRDCYVPGKRRRSGNKERVLADGSNGQRPADHLGSHIPWEDLTGTRNARSVWTINTKPFPEAHFATFPEALPRRCILAGTSERGACSTCGSPWKRDRPGRVQGREGDTIEESHGADGRSGNRMNVVTTTVSWSATCICGGGGVMPCVVLDPFAGAATTGVVALAFQRSFLGIELNADYVAMARKRIERDGASLFAQAAP